MLIKAGIEGKMVRSGDLGHLDAVRVNSSSVGGNSFLGIWLGVCSSLVL